MCNSFSLKYFFITAIICFASAFAFSQERMVVFETKVIDKQKKAIKNVKVTLYESNKELVSGKTPKDGYFSFELDLEKKYFIKLSHPDYFDKNIEINTDVPPAKMKRYFYIEYDTKMVEKTGDIGNNSFFDEAHRKLAYNDVIEEIENNLSHERKMDNRLTELIKGEKIIREEVESLVITYNNHIDNDKPEDAEKILKEIIKLSPKDARINIFRKQIKDKKVELLLVEAEKYAKQKRFRRAKGFIDRARETDPENTNIDEVENRINEAIEEENAKKDVQETDTLSDIEEAEADIVVEEPDTVETTSTNPAEGITVKSVGEDSIFAAKKEELETEAIKNEMDIKSEIVEEQKLNKEEEQKKKETQIKNKEIIENKYSEILKKVNRGSGEDLYLNVSEISIKPKKYPIISEEIDESYFVDVTTTIIIMPNEKIILHKYDYTFGSTYYFIGTKGVEKDDYNHELEKYFRKK